MRLLGQFQAGTIFFPRKDLAHTKTQANINQQNKIKQALNKGKKFFVFTNF